MTQGFSQLTKNNIKIVKTPTLEFEEPRVVKIPECL